MFILYTVAPLLYRLASSAYFNLSLLSSDFYGLLFGKITSHFSNSPLTRALICATGLFLFVRRAFCILLFATFLSTIFEKHFQPYWLYFPSFTVVILGLIVYFWHATRMSIEIYYLLLPHDFSSRARRRQ